MKVQAIDCLYIAADRTAYCRLGLRTRTFESGPPTFHVGQGGGGVGLMFADYKSGVPARTPLPIRPGLFAVAVRVDDVPATVSRLSDRNVPASSNDRLGWFLDDDRAGTPLAFNPGSWQRDFDPGHTFPLKRLDHLAAVAHD